MPLTSVAIDPSLPVTEKTPAEELARWAEGRRATIAAPRTLILSPAAVGLLSLLQSESGDQTGAAQGTAIWHETVTGQATRVTRSITLNQIKRPVEHPQAVRPPNRHERRKMRSTK